MLALHKFDHWLPKMLDVEAITLAPFVLYSKPRWKVPYSLIMHEKVHLRQVKENGWFTFYLSYLWEYVDNRLSGFDSYNAYRMISFEVEAYKEQAKWEQNQKHGGQS